MKKIEMLIIDPQYDFIDIPEDFKVKSMDLESGNVKVVEPALAVEGAWDDSIRLAKFIKKFGSNINQIRVTMDTHQLYDISHPLFWVNKNNKHPDPFTPISLDDIEKGNWKPVDNTKMDYVKNYASTLEKKGLYSLFIWPPHCLIGTDGYKVVQPIMDQLLDWENKYIGRVNYVTKGHNPFTEHYGGFEAEVPIDTDPTTLLNMNLIKTIEQSDVVFLSGQALSHCVSSTVRQLVNNFGEENIKKLVLLIDTTSPVKSFENQANEFVEEMRKKGMKILKTTDVVFENGNFKI